MNTNFAKVNVKDIRIGYRIRKDAKNILDLADNINAVGLINPITVMREDAGTYLLLAGYRRLEAVKTLGRSAITANVLTPMESDRQLQIEIAENEHRQDFTSAERLEYAEKLKAVEAEKAKERMAAGGRGGIEAEEGTVTRPYLDKGEARKIVAQKAGFTSEAQMRRTKYVADHKPELLEKIDTGETTVYEAYKAAKPAAPGEDPDRFADVPLHPRTYDPNRNTKEARAELAKIEETLIPQRPVKPLDTYDAYNPFMDDEAAFTRHMKDPFYAKLYEQYQAAIAYGNRMHTEALNRCEQYEKEICHLRNTIAFYMRREQTREAECANETSSTDS